MTTLYSLFTNKGERNEQLLSNLLQSYSVVSSLASWKINLGTWLAGGGGGGGGGGHCSQYCIYLSSSLAFPAYRKKSYKVVKARR